MLPHQAMPPGKSRGEGGLGPMSERELAARKAYEEAVDQAQKAYREVIAQTWKAYNEAKA